MSSGIRDLLFHYSHDYARIDCIHEQCNILNEMMRIKCKNETPSQRSFSTELKFDDFSFVMHGCTFITNDSKVIPMSFDTTERIKKEILDKVKQTCRQICSWDNMRSKLLDEIQNIKRYKDQNEKELNEFYSMNTDELNKIPNLSDYVKYRKNSIEYFDFLLQTIIETY